MFDFNLPVKYSFVIKQKEAKMLAGIIKFLLGLVDFHVEMEQGILTVSIVLAGKEIWKWNFNFGADSGPKIMSGAVLKANVSKVKKGGIA